LVDPEELCGGCPVLADCRTYADNVGNAYGVWGGRLYEDGKVVNLR